MAVSAERHRLLLVSNSTLHGGGYLDHVASEVAAFFRGCRSILFAPFALFDRDAYAERARERFRAMGLRLESLHDAGDPIERVRNAPGIFVGGGNTFRLLDALARGGLLEPIREAVSAGVPYLGSSAGAIVACPTLRTTKDMPIVEPPSFEALGLVDFQISPHYLDPDPASTHMGETQEERILQYLEENAAPVVGLREGAFLRVAGDSVVLAGVAGARLFRRGAPPLEARPERELGAWLSGRELA